MSGRKIFGEVVVCDDLPAEYVRFLYGDRIKGAQVFSRNDAINETKQKPVSKPRARRSNAGFKLGKTARITVKPR